MKKNPLIFAHYDRQGELRLDTQNLLEELSQYFAPIIFVSTKMNQRNLDKIPGNISIIIRENIGYDFYSYREGLSHLTKGFIESFNYENISFMNSSFYCGDCKKIVTKYHSGITRNNFDLVGLTMHKGAVDTPPHVQSYLFSLSQEVIRNPSVLEWWKHMLPINDRNIVIQKYEIGLSKLISDCGFDLKSLYVKSLPYRLKKVFLKPLIKIKKIFGYSKYVRVPSPIHEDFTKIYDIYGIVKIEIICNNSLNAIRLLGLNKETTRHLCQ